VQTVSEYALGRAATSSAIGHVGGIYPSNAKRASDPARKNDFFLALPFLDLHFLNFVMC
jgi:hypothetical protein